MHARQLVPTCTRMLASKKTVIKWSGILVDTRVPTLYPLFKRQSVHRKPRIHAGYGQCTRMLAMFFPGFIWRCKRPDSVDIFSANLYNIFFLIGKKYSS